MDMHAILHEHGISLINKSKCLLPGRNRTDARTNGGLLSASTIQKTLDFPKRHAFHQDRTDDLVMYRNQRDA
jgi:hypothetical protein